MEEQAEIKDPEIKDLVAKAKEQEARFRQKEDWFLANKLKDKFVEIIDVETEGKAVSSETLSDLTLSRRILAERGKDLLAIISSETSFSQDSAVPDFVIVEDLGKEAIIDRILEREDLLSNQYIRDFAWFIFERENMRHRGDLKAFREAKKVPRRRYYEDKKYQREIKRMRERSKLTITYRAELLALQINEAEKKKAK